MYLSGTKDEIDGYAFRKLVTDESLTNYTLSYDYKIIDNDPTRRYFETHLAAITLKNSLKKLDIEDLTSHHQFLYDLLSETKKKEVTEIFYNPTLPLGQFNIEYVSVLKSLNDTPSYKEASELDQEKMCLLIKCSILSVFLMTNKPSTISFPIGIYNIGLFKKENRGVKTLFRQENVHSNHLGIVKSYMPLPISDIAYRENKPFPYLRSADNTTFYSDAQWPRKNFRLLTHPFSSSISGTILCHLRVAKYLLDQSSLSFKNSKHFANFIRCVISVLLYQTGGHSLNEYVSVLTLPEVINAFDQLENFNSIDEKTLFFTENKAAFYQAIDATIVYCNTLLRKEKLHNELKNDFSKEEDDQFKNEELISKINK
ncbi:hypothetical protein [Rickettsiella massiliensis]|uniref:hypothetical protein n=1 Tax=Rickettsiella massiliensis TaxID=676517 RepID=UPI00029A4780|nr:hypothetical protein [Rickettsiella massiliensis]